MHIFPSSLAACTRYLIFLHSISHFLFIFALTLALFYYTQMMMHHDVDRIEKLYICTSSIICFNSFFTIVVVYKDVINNFSMPQNYRWMQNCIYVLNLINHNDRANVVFSRQKIASEQEEKND